MYDTTPRSRVHNESAKNAPNGRTPDALGPQITADIDFFVPATHALVADKHVSHPAYRLWCVLHMLRWKKEPPTMERLQAEMASNEPAKRATAESIAQTNLVPSQQEAPSPKRRGATLRTRPATRRSIELWLCELEDAGWLTWHRGAEITTRYHLHTQPRSADESMLTQIRAMLASGKASLEDIRALLDTNTDSYDEPADEDTNPDSQTTNLDSHDTNPDSQTTNLDSHDTNPDSQTTNLDSYAPSIHGVRTRQKRAPNKKDRSKERSSTTNNAGDGGQSEIARYLRTQGIGAAHELATRFEQLGIPLQVVQDDLERRRARGQPDGIIVQAWRVEPPRARPTTSDEGPIDVSRYLGGEYAGLFVRGGDMDEEDLDEQEVGVG